MIVLITLLITQFYAQRTAVGVAAIYFANVWFTYRCNNGRMNGISFRIYIENLNGVGKFLCHTLFKEIGNRRDPSIRNV